MKTGSEDRLSLMFTLQRVLYAGLYMDSPLLPWGVVVLSFWGVMLSHVPHYFSRHVSNFIPIITESYISKHWARCRAQKNIRLTSQIN